ncbi:MAG: iron-containing alcohol dehydrogenase, partial [Solirubrobacterales bacterium]
MHDEREYGIEAGAKAPTGKHTFLPLEGVSFGPGAIAELGPELERLGCSRALVVTGKTIAGETDLIARLEAVLGPKLAGVFAASGQHVPRASVLAAA